ncbi:hypothetical protein M758_7G010100 [Ceratodon purpureus]|nr:hypothetical protein M758_7G010100 [Ceratodon purpureus]
MSIAKDVASALLYLHEETASRIGHPFLTPAYMLLDEEMNARVADSGLARLLADQKTVDLVTNVMGSRGYLGPEYALNGQLSNEVDVHSYGVVLLELVSGRHGLQPSPDLPEPVPISMVPWAREARLARSTRKKGLSTLTQARRVSVIRCAQHQGYGRDDLPLGEFPKEQD